MNAETTEGFDRNTTNQSLHIEVGTSNTNYKYNESQSNMESIVLANKLELMNQTSSIIQNVNLNSDSTNLYNDANIISLNIEDGCIHSEVKTFDLQQWIDKQIDSNSHLCSTNTQNQTTLAAKQFELHFNSKFNENHLELQEVVKEYSSNKIPYTFRKNDYLKGLKKHLNSKDVDLKSTFNEYEISNENENNSSFEEDSPYKSNKNYANSNMSISEDEDDESCIYKDLLDDDSNFEDDLSLQELSFFNKKHETEQSHTQSNYNKDTNCLKYEFKGISKIPIEIRDKLRLDKTLFYDSISSVQPYFQDNLEGPISQPNLKIESARLSNKQNIFPCSSPEINKTKPTLKHQNSNKRIQRTRSLKEIVIYNKEPNTSFDGFKQLPEETQEFLERIMKKSSQRLSNYQRVADKVTEMTTINLKEELETMYKLDNDLQNIVENMATPSTSKACVNNSNTQGSQLQKEVEIQTSKFLRKKATSSKNSMEANNILLKKKKKKKKMKDKILRNIQLGPDARYYRLTQEEEDLVEKILNEPNTIDNQTNDGCSVASFASTGYDFDEDDAKRIAEINSELEHLQHHLHDSCSVSNQCDKEESDHCISTYENPLSSRANSTQCEINLKILSILTKEGNSIVCTRKSSHQSNSKIKCDCISNGTPNTSNIKINNYLEEQRLNRKCQERIKEIDKMLKELEDMELPKLTDEELEVLLIQCKYEQGLVSTKQIESNLLDSTYQMENKPLLKNISEQDKMLEFDQIVISECGTLHLVHPIEDTFDLNHYNATSQINHEVVASA